jgi:SAM-dependent methyltransferase
MPRSEALSLYSSPEIYDVAFGWDLTLEIDFLEQCWATHVPGVVKRVLEPACGTGRILEALARRGYEVLGYDRGPEMVAYAAGKVGTWGGKVCRGEMSSFRPPGHFDAALNLVNSIGYLLDEEGILSHLARVGESLRDGGVYIVQLSYAGEPPDQAAFGPWGNRRGDLSTSLTWAVLREDLVSKRSFQRGRVEARRGEERILIEEEHVLRLWTQEDFDRLIAQSPFELVAVYHDRFDRFPADLPRTGEHGNLYHVLRRRP